MSRPTRVPRFATGAIPGDLVEPPGGTVLGGWQKNTRPPSSYFNWLQLRYGQWVDQLRGPNLNEWVRRAWSTSPTALAIGARIDYDPLSEDGSTLCFRYVIAGNTSGAAKEFRVSRRGVEWATRTNLPGAVDGHLEGVAFLVTTSDSDGKWWCWTSNPGVAGWICWTHPDNATHHVDSGISDNSVPWTIATTTGKGVLALDALGNQMAAATEDGVVVSTDGGATWAAGTLAAHTGTPLDLVVADATFVLITTTGAVLSTKDVTDTWALQATLGADTWKLSAGGLAGATVIAYAYCNGVETDHMISGNSGQTWSAKNPPDGLKTLLRIRYAGGVWVACSEDVPYLWESNDLDVWRRLWLPLDESSNWMPRDIVFDGGAWVMTGESWTLMSGRAADTWAT